MTVRLFRATNARDEDAVWADLGESEPQYVADRDRFPDGAGGDAAWSLLVEQIPAVT